ncbi:hypothetical protein ACEWY4_026206 [Coilia grayii]|uniref:Rab11 family-interacting protein 3 n=1 Tax=Coilia grayii TaxID=363190 RepID=A0ABD1IU78_9TELE
MRSLPPEPSSENTPAPDSCCPDAPSESISVCAEDQDTSLTPAGQPFLLTCTGEQPGDVGGASGQTCPANQTLAELKVQQGEEEEEEGETLALNQFSSDQVTQAPDDGSSPTERSTQQLMEEKNSPALPEYESLGPDPPGSMEVPTAGSIPVAVGSPSDPLRAVFQALDQDGDGFVRMEEFLEFAAAYGAEQVKDLTRFLDPSGLGVISFEDFHRGITAISSGGSDPDLYRLELSATDAGVPPEEGSSGLVLDLVVVRAPVVLESSPGKDHGTGYDRRWSKPLWVLELHRAPRSKLRCRTVCTWARRVPTASVRHSRTRTRAHWLPPELHEDVETDSGIENTLTEGDDLRNRFSLGADLHGHALSAVIGGEEEHFEDFGESNTSDLLLTNHEEGRPGPEGAGDPEPHPHARSPSCCPSVLSPSGGAMPANLQALLQSEALDFFCSHCHKQISRLEDLSTRLHLLEMNSSGKRLSSKKAARLLQNSALGLDSMGDLSHSLLDLTDTDLTDKVLLLERRVCELEQDSAQSEEQHGRLRQENLALVHRANALEEQLKEQELRADDTLHLHARKHRDALAKLQRERDLDIENLQARLHQLDEENSELRSCVPCLRANIERLEEEKRKLQDEVEDISERLNEELDSRKKMADKLSHERHNNQKEKECMQELIEDLRKQLEHLQLFKLEMEAKRGRSPSAGLQEYNTRTREHELEQEIRRLKQDNRSLKEQNDELNGQIINLSIQGAKSLVTESFSESLAAEINSVSRGELMEAVHKQKEINFRLQDYIDKIIVAIMESNPSILEVK